MSDVARHAGVDVSTVSRALNDRTATMLRPETVERVLASVATLGYQPNAIARGLRTQRSQTVGMLVPDITNPFFPPIVRGLGDELVRHGYTLIISNTDNEPEREASDLAGLLSRQVDGMVIATSHVGAAHTSERLAALPVVLVNRRDDDPTAPFVVPDDEVGVRAVVDHLVGLGHRSIGHLAGPQDTSTGRARLAAFQRAIEDAGVDSAGVEATRIFDIDAGQAACTRLLDGAGAMTAIVAANDLLAVGALRALRERGIAVPGGMSVVGYNDMPLVDLLDPPLTTVRVPQYEMGQTAARIMLTLLADRRDDAPPDVATDARQVTLEPRLVVRGSTAPPG